LIAGGPILQGKMLASRLIARAMQPVHRAAMRRLQRRIFDQVNSAMQVPQPNLPRKLTLPENYGKGMPERTIELLLAKLTYKPGVRVLDVGHANAQDCHLRLLRTLAPPTRLTGVDIAPPTYNTAAYYERTISADITHVPEPDGAFDMVWCISTIEHVGLDNSAYTDRFEVEEDMDMKAARELLRLTAPGGALLLTVPYGRAQNLGWSRNYDRSRWQTLLNIFQSGGVVNELYFRHTYGRGWEPVLPEELTYVGYYDQANFGAGGMAAAIVQKSKTS
jgi:SAM-dependent methyltransferase